MKNIIITLGCGAQVPNLVMGEGSSSYLGLIKILYSREEILEEAGLGVNDYINNKIPKYVSSEMVSKMIGNQVQKALKNHYDNNDDHDKVIRVIVATGSLFCEGQREGRVNQIFYGYTDINPSTHTTLVDGAELPLFQTELTYVSREADEAMVAEIINDLVVRDEP